MVFTRRIHIVGSGPRTGTSLLAEAMNACFNIDLYPSHEDQLFVSAPTGVDTFLTKHPQDLFLVGPRLQVDPYFFVIYMVRDPRDIITSVHPADPDRYWTGLRYWKAFRPLSQQLDHLPRFITVRYEDFVSDPDATQKRLSRLLPFLTPQVLFSQYHEVANPDDASNEALDGLRPITPKSVGRWKNHLPRVAAQIHLHGPITPDLIDYGYESDASWLDCLQGVAPSFCDSHWPEYFTEDDLRDRQKGKYREALKALMRRGGLPPARIKSWIGG